MLKLVTRKLAIIILLANAVACSNHTNTVQRSVEIFIDKSQLLSQLAFLSSEQMAGRKIASAGSKKAQTYIIEQLKLANVKPYQQNYRHPFDIKKGFKHYQGTNIVGLIPANKLSQHYLILSAHYDHIGTKGNKVFYGADDNASGTAALLTIAALLQQELPKHNIVVIFTDGEEVALLGAKAFVDNNLELLESTLVNINLDMLAGAKGTKRLRYIHAGLDKLLSKTTLVQFLSSHQAASIKVKAGFGHNRLAGNNRRQWRFASDHGAFYQQGIPFIYYGVGEHKNYHQISDIYQHVNHEFFIQVTQTVYQQIRFLDKILAEAAIKN